MGLLQEHQRQIHALLDEAETVLTGAGPPQPPALAAIRWQLMRQLRRYQLFKHGEIFTPASRSGDIPRMLLACEMRDSCLAATDAYERHVRKWSEFGVDGDWVAYRADACSVIASIQTNLARELADAGKLLPATDDHEQSPCATGAGPPDDTPLPIPNAQMLLDARRIIGGFLSSPMFANPAHDILLTILAAEEAGQTTTMSACIAKAQVTQIIGNRWIRLLAAEGLVACPPDGSHDGSPIVTLTERSRLTLKSYIACLSSCLPGSP